MFHKITVVTCWYHINNKYQLSQYTEWFKRFLQLNINLVIYTNEESKKMIESYREKRNTVYIIRPFTEFKTYSFLEYWEHCEKIDIEKKYGCGHNKFLYMIWNERYYHWMQEVTQTNPFNSTHFVWCDIGIVREEEMVSKIRSFPAGILNLQPHQFLLSQVDHFYQHETTFHSDGILNVLHNINEATSCNVINKVQGGFFGGTHESIQLFTDMYKSHLSRFITTKQFAGKDQYVLNNLVIECLQTKNTSLAMLPPDINTWPPNSWASFMINLSKVPLITTFIQGGLGNQLFQVAIALSAAFKSNGVAIFKNEKPPGITDRGTYWDTILHKLNHYSSIDNHLGESFREVHEHWNHSVTPYSITGNTKFIGYFQSSVYFNEYKQEIKQLFTLREIQLKKVNKQLQEIKKDENRVYIAIHVRRGDYIKLGWNLPIEYYMEAINKIKHDLQDKQTVFVVFSDDIQWCKETFNQQSEMFYFVTEGSDIEQLFLIKSCDGLIGSNSSFSWWSTYLSDTHKSVYVPYPWFKGQNYNPLIYEKEWKQINW